MVEHRHLWVRNLNPIGMRVRFPARKTGMHFRQRRKMRGIRN